MRTAIAVIAFGFVIEKFNLFVLTVANANSLDAGRRLELERLSGPLGRYDGLALILLGIALVVVAATRFVRTGQLVDDQETHSVGGVRAELLAPDWPSAGCKSLGRFADAFRGRYDRKVD